MSREKVLSLLLEQGDRYVSGEAMSRTLGISRAAVWKAIEALRQEGYTIQSAPNRGYRLSDAPDRVREGELSGPLSGCRVGGSLMCLETIDSTNTQHEDLDHGLLAELLAAGRGAHDEAVTVRRQVGVEGS